MRPNPLPTPGPTPTEHGWFVQNNENKKSSSPTVTNWSTRWTNPPTLKPTYSPTLDQCRAAPCDYEGECRSGLGFCGTGIVYCNSQSSWIPSCNPDAELPIRLDGNSIATVTPAESEGGNREPTPTPTTAWEAWVNNKNGKPDSDSSGNSTAKNETEGSNIPPEAYDIGWFNANTENSDTASWWTRSSLSVRPMPTLILVPVAMLAGFWFLVL